MPDPLADVTLTRFQSSVAFAGSPYVVGPTYADIPERATFEFKAGSTGYTGGGYARVRSKERGRESGHGGNDVFASIHRLAAVVWCYGDDVPLREINRDMVGRDVHHELGMPSANVPGAVSIHDHGDHSRTTQAMRRAWAEDAKRARDAGGYDGEDEGDTCERCGKDVAATVGETSLCMAHATKRGRETGETVELV